MKTRPSWILGTVAMGMALASCGSTAVDDNHGTNGGSSAALDPASFGQKYRFADNEIPGWTQSTDPTAKFPPYGVYSDATLEQRIDGGNLAYTSRGMRVAMYQDLVGPSDAQVTIVAMAFSSASNASTMFDYEVASSSATIAIPSYDQSTALAYPTLAGITTYAHVQASYFELKLTGIPDQTDAAQATQQFLQVLVRKSE